MVVSNRYVGRLAPSPTGLLHLGHARTFWVAHARVRAAGGTLWLRNEDLDAQRAKAVYAAAMKDDLAWLGITWDAEMRQSDRLAVYAAAMRRLIAAGAVYPCTCSRKDLAEAIAAPHEDDDEPLYGGRCRADVRTGDFVAGVNYRMRVPDGEAIEFSDALAGAQRFVAARDFGDFLAWRKDGLPSYQLACVVDDAAIGVTEVVRGRDLLKSTARQMVLQRALGFRTPAYAHCELLRDKAGMRLAKRHDALSLQLLRERGVTPEDVRAMF